MSLSFESINFPIDLFDHRVAGLLQKFVRRCTRGEYMPRKNKRHVFDNVSPKVIEKELVFRHHVPDLIKVRANRSRQEIEAAPGLFKLFKLFKSQVFNLDIVAKALACVIAAVHKLPMRGCLLNHTISCKSKAQVKTELPSVDVYSILLSIRVNFSHCAAIGESATTERNKGGSQRLPLAQVKGDHDDQDDSDRGRYTGPFKLLHSTKLPSRDLVVERVAA